MTATAQNQLETDVQVSLDGCARVVVRGWLDAQTAVACWNLLEQKLRPAKIKILEVDASSLRFCDGTGLALLRYLNMGRMTPGATVSVLGLEEDLEKLFRGFTLEDYEAFRPPLRTESRSLPEEVGKEVSQLTADLREQVETLGTIVANLPPTIPDRKRMCWAEVRRVLELAGANAVSAPIAATLMKGWNQGLAEILAEMASDLRHSEIADSTAAP